MRMLDVPDVRWLDMVGRLRDGTSVVDTAAALNVVGRRLQAAYPESNCDISATAKPLGEGRGFRREARPLLRLLAVAVALVLLIAVPRTRGRGGRNDQFVGTVRRNVYR
jgi:hypothetical protein